VVSEGRHVSQIAVRCGLEVVVERELDCPRYPTHVCYLSKVAVRDPVVWVRIAGDVEGIEEVRTELQSLFVVEVEFLPGAEVNLLEARRALGADSS
jgi:hypothetical protein